MEGVIETKGSVAAHIGVHNVAIHVSGTTTPEPMHTIFFWSFDHDTLEWRGKWISRDLLGREWDYGGDNQQFLPKLARTPTCFAKIGFRQGCLCFVGTLVAYSYSR